MITPTSPILNHHPATNMWVPYDGRVYKTTYDLLINNELFLNYRPNGGTFYIDTISDHGLRTNHLSKIDGNLVDYVRITPDVRLGPSKSKGEDRIAEQMRWFKSYIPSVKGIVVDGYSIEELDAGYSIHGTDLLVSKTFPLGITANGMSVTPDFDTSNIIRVLTLNSEFVCP
jgi:hypothetical protein